MPDVSFPAASLLPSCDRGGRDLGLVSHHSNTVTWWSRGAKLKVPQDHRTETSSKWVALPIVLRGKLNRAESLSVPRLPPRVS